MQNRNTIGRVVLTTAVVGGVVLAGAASSSTRNESPALASARSLSNAFRDAARDVAPSVVSITSVATNTFPPGRRGQGTGFIVSTDGYIVTNDHVVRNADELTVTLGDDRTLEASLVGADPETDLAVIKVEADDLDAVTMGDSDTLEVGEWVIAVGSPFGLDQTVTAGIVSATGRSRIGLATYESFIQTDAAINPGNSGGPLVNLDGEVVGVNTAITSRSGGNDGVGFAIPAAMASTVLDDIIDDGRVARGWLGVSIQPLTDDMAASFGLDADTEGVLLSDVLPGGPAERAGLHAGDVVTAIDAAPMRDPNVLRLAVAAADPDETVTLEVIRDGATLALDVTLGERAGVNGLAMETDLGLQVAPADEGVTVDRVAPSSPADRAGLRPGDVILQVGWGRVGSPDDLWQALRSSDLETGARLLVRRGMHKQFAILKAS